MGLVSSMSTKKYGITRDGKPVGIGPAPGFTWGEVRDGWGKLPVGDYRAMRRLVYQARYLNQLRTGISETYGIPKRHVFIHVTSWFRSWAYNRKIGGATSSQHPQSRATDIVVVVRLSTGRVVRLNPKWVGKLAQRHVDAFDEGGIGVYGSRSGNFTHVDHRSYRARWGDW